VKYYLLNYVLFTLSADYTLLSWSFVISIF